MRRAALALLALALLCEGARADASFPPPAAPTAADLSAVIAGKGWVASTGVVSVPASGELDAILTNPAGSGCTAVLTVRRLSNPNSTLMAWQDFDNPPALTGQVSAPVLNRLVGGAPSSVLTFAYGSPAQGTMGGVPRDRAPLPTNFEEDVAVPVVLLPGRSFGVSVTSLTGLLASALPVSVAFAGYCA